MTIRLIDFLDTFDFNGKDIRLELYIAGELTWVGMPSLMPIEYNYYIIDQIKMGDGNIYIDILED